MQTIRQLLSRIRWDAEFGAGDFKIGIYDRVADVLDFFPVESLHIEPGNRATFTLCIDGEIRTIPYHRIHAVRKNGECIWKR